MKLRTLTDVAHKYGTRISQSMTVAASKILSSNGFDPETGTPLCGVTLTDGITGKSGNTKTPNDGRAEIQQAIDKINENRKEKILLSAGEILLESANAEDTVYISIDDIGVKAQKEERGEGHTRSKKYVENTVAHIQYAGGEICLTDVGMKELFKAVLACLISNDLLQYRLVFLTDGARNLKKNIEEIFAFHPYCMILRSKLPKNGIPSCV